MPLIQIQDIKVEERQREDYGDIPDFASSLADPKFGQLQPVLLDRNNRLLAGGRRVTAAAYLLQTGSTIHGYQPGEVWFEYKDSLNDEQAEAIELEENVRRKQLTWQESQKALAKLYAYRAKEDPTKTADQIAEQLGVSRRTLFNAVELSKAIDEHPDIAKADTPSGAMLRLNRKKDLANREADIRVAALAVGLGMENRTRAQIIHGDALEGLRGLESESVDGVIFNPPFGVEIESLFTSGRKIYENDGPIEMTLLTEQIVEEAYRVLKPDRWMVIFYPTARLEDVKGIGAAMWDRIVKTTEKFQQAQLATGVSAPNFWDALRAELEDDCGGMLARHGFTFQKVPAQWIKPNKRVSAMGDPYAQLNINYETFYFARKGKAQLRKIPPSNTFIVDTPGIDRIHPLEMPKDLWKTILEAICVGGESIVEPFAGSGSGGEAAVDLGINYLGWELDGEFALHGQTRLVGALAGVLQPRNGGGRRVSVGSDTPGGGEEVPTNNRKLSLVRGPGGTITIDATSLDNSVFE